MKRAAIWLLAEERRLLIGVAAHKYALMPADRKAALYLWIVASKRPDATCED